MSFQIDTAFSKQYKDTITLLVQQGGSRLRDSVRNEVQIGEKAFWEQIGATSAKLKTTRHGDSPLVSTPHSRRQSTMLDYEWGDYIDQNDMNKMIIDPTSMYMLNARNAMGRAIDDAIITNALGTAFTGKEGATSVTFPATQVVTATSGLNLAALTATLEKFNANNVDPDEEKYLVCGSQQITNLLGINQVTSVDFNTNRALTTGKVGSFMGFTFIQTERLPKVSTVRSCIAYTKSGLLLALGKDITTNIAQRPDKSFSWYIYACMSIGATRMEEERVVRIDCTEV